MANNFLNMSDEEFLKNPPSFNDEGGDSLDTTSENTSEEYEDTSTEEVLNNNESEAQEDTTEEETEEQVSQPKKDTFKEHEPFSDSNKEESLDTDKKPATDTKEDTLETDEVDYKSAYERITAPFKANGVNMQVKDPEDIIRLMQMGANYQKKMAQLKPNLKVVKMLENNGLLDENKLNNLIDLHKKDPQAIAKLLKDSGIDPLELNTEEADKYKPNNYSVSDSEYNIDAVLESIKHTPEFPKTINVITKEWDNQSRIIISENPEIINVINTHMSNGVFDKVNAILYQEKALGRLVGIPDVQAYYNIATHLANNGGLRIVNNNNPIPKQGNTSPATSTVSSEKQKEDVERDARRKAAAITTSRKVSTPPETKNYLAMSDEEFMKTAMR